MAKLDLYILEINDTYSRDNFRKIDRSLREQSLLKGNFKFFEITVTKAVTNLKFQHNMGFAPKDIIQTSHIGVGLLTWNYALFDAATLDITTTGACVVRAFVGSYEEGIT